MSRIRPFCTWLQGYVAEVTSSSSLGELGGRAVACCGTGTAFGARENIDSYVLNEKQGQHAMHLPRRS